MGDSYSKKAALESPETLATVIHAIIKDKYGEEAYDWDPVTMYLELKDDFKADVNPEALDRWNAMQIVMSTGAFFERLDAFLSICNTLSSGVPFFQVFDPVTVEEAAWAITEVSLNRELKPFSYPIRQFLKMILKRDGYTPSTWPSVFSEVFQDKPSAEDIREELGALENRDKVEGYVDEQLKDLVYQFNQIPSLKELDDILLRKSMDEFVGDVV